MQDIGKRLVSLANAKTPDAVETNLLTVASKKASCIVMVLDAIHRKGLASSDFKEVFDRAQTCLVLAPPASVPWPGYIMWARQRLAINEHTGDIPVWLDKVGVSALKSCGVKDVDVEQQNFVSEVLSAAFKLADYKSCLVKLAEMFTWNKLDLLNQHLHEDIYEFAVCFQTTIEWDTVLEWAEIEESNSGAELEAMLDMAIALFLDAEDVKSDLPASTRFLANLVLGYPKGRRLVEERKHNLEALKAENRKAKHFSDAAKNFSGGMDKALSFFLFCARVKQKKTNKQTNKQTHAHKSTHTQIIARSTSPPSTATARRTPPFWLMNWPRWACS